MYMYTLDYKSSHGSYVSSMVKGLLDVATSIMVGSIMCTLHDFMQGGHTLSYIVGSLSGCGIYMWSKNAIGMDALSKFWF